MKISIIYESSWRNSFLDGSNNEPLPKDGRKFIGSMTELKKEGNFKKHEITLDTVMGVLNRLIGDQRKLYQSRQEQYGAYFFKQLEAEQKIQFIDRAEKKIESQEIVYIRNVSGSTDQNSFAGLIKSNDLWLTSEFSKEFWNVLWLNEEELLSFILNGSYFNPSFTLEPLAISSRFKEIKNIKFLISENILQAREYLLSKYPKFSPKEFKDKCGAEAFYCTALYLQLDRLSKFYDISFIKAPKGGLEGISHNNFTEKNFMARFTTGAKKLVWGNPYLHKIPIKGQGEVTSVLTKASGMLDIYIHLDTNDAKQLKSMIENAGVSTFYLGKKGLAYLSEIRLGENLEMEI